MTYAIAGISTFLCALFAFISLDKGRTESIPLLRTRGEYMDVYTTKTFSKRKCFIIVACLAFVSGIISYFMADRAVDLLWLLRMSVALVCTTGAACNDYRERRIPNAYPLLIAIASLIIMLISVINGEEGAGRQMLLCIAVAVAVAFFMIIVRALSKDGIGYGDIKLLAAISLASGVYTTIEMLFFGMLACLIISLIALATGRKRLSETLPFAPFILVGLWLSITNNIM